MKVYNIKSFDCTASPRSAHYVNDLLQNGYKLIVDTNFLGFLRNEFKRENISQKFKPSNFIHVTYPISLSYVNLLANCNASIRIIHMEILKANVKKLSGNEVKCHEAKYTEYWNEKNYQLLVEILNPN